MLRLGKRLIVVPNPTLLDNHQEDVASSLNALGYLKASTIEYVLTRDQASCVYSHLLDSNLPNAIENFDPSSITPFPPFDGSRFSTLLNEEMGFI